MLQDDFTAEGRWEPKNSKRLRTAFARAVVSRFGLAANAHISVLNLENQLVSCASYHKHLEAKAEVNALLSTVDRQSYEGSFPDQS